MTDADTQQEQGGSDEPTPAGPESKVPLGGPIENQPEPEIETHEGTKPVSEVDNPVSNPIEQNQQQGEQQQGL